MTEWLDWMKPMPPMSAARLKTWSQPFTTFRQLSYTRKSTSPPRRCSGPPALAVYRAAQASSASGCSEVGLVRIGRRRYAAVRDGLYLLQATSQVRRDKATSAGDADSQLLLPAMLPFEQRQQPSAIRMRRGPNPSDAQLAVG
eukprot:scaffold179_cov368-Prasinococcus_capsulatus_cf.AAC.27